MSVRRKEIRLGGNGGQWAHYAHDESGVDIDHLWGDEEPAAAEAPALAVVPDPEPAPTPVVEAPVAPGRLCESCKGQGGHTGPSGKRTECSVCAGAGTFPDITPLEVGTDSGLRTRARISSPGEPIIATEHNADLLAMLTQDDIDSRSDLWYDLSDIESTRIQAGVEPDEVTLPESPTPEQVAVVAENIDKAFTLQLAQLSGSKHDARRVLREVYGTEDRALVAVGAAVAARADELANGFATGGAEATEQRWLDRRLAKEEQEMAAFVASNRERWSGLSDSEIASRFYKSSDLIEVEAARDPKTRQALADMADAYTDALAELRPMGGEITLHFGSSKPSAAVVASTAAIWPTDWLSASNNCPIPLHIGTSINRAHYVHEHAEPLTRRGQGEAFIGHFDAAENEASGLQGLKHLTKVPTVDENGNPISRGTWLQGDRVSTYVSYERLTDDEKAAKGFGVEQNSYRVKEWEYRDVDQTHGEYRDYLKRVAVHVLNPYPVDAVSELDTAGLEALVRSAAAGTRHKVKKHPLDGGEVVTDPSINGGKPFYRKPKTRANELLAEPISTIKLSKDWTSGPKGRDTRYAPAVHELGHRMEYLVPNLNAMARSWRSRRVDESPTEEGKELRTIYRGTSERGYTDEFVSHYIGKSYDDRSESVFYRRPRGAAENFVEATEAFSMGSDSVFGGRNGGLIGLSRDKRPDADMRNFILGVFASAGRWKGDGGA